MVHSLSDYADQEIPWLTAVMTFTSEIPEIRPKNKTWYYYVEYCAREGVVHRLVENAKTQLDWYPGLMYKNTSGTKWVWKKHTLAELHAKGIALQLQYGTVTPWTDSKRSGDQALDVPRDVIVDSL